MFEGRLHAFDFRGADAERLGDVSPGRDRTADFFRHASGLFIVDTEVFGDLKGEFERGRLVVFIDGQTQDAQPDIGGSGVKVVSGCQLPSHRSRPKETVVTEMIVDVRNQNRKNDSAPKFGQILAGIRAA